MNARMPGACLIAAAVLFWICWVLMPGVGITDTELILNLVGQHRGEVLLSVVLQLISAALYVPALVGVVTTPGLGEAPGVRRASSLLLIGAMGSAADAIYHLLAHAMTAPGIVAADQVEVMRTMQGPNLRYILPMVLAFFVGSIWLSIAFTRKGLVPRWNPLLFVLAVVVAFGGGMLASGTPGAGRYVGLSVLALVSASQAWLGLALIRAPRA